MNKYPHLNQTVVVKETGEKHVVKQLWKPGRVVLDDSSIMYLSGIEPEPVVHIYFNEDYPKGYTTAKNSHEAYLVATALLKATQKPWSVVSGSLHWKTGKPAYYTIYTEE